jgi:hypothetical protein
MNKKSLTAFAKRITRLKIPILMGYEIFFILYLWFRFRATFYYIDWFIAIGVGSLTILLLLELIGKIPLPFVEPISKTNYGLLFAIPLCCFLILALIANILTPLFPHLQYLTLQLPSTFNIVVYIDVGIVEDSMKVALTNLLSWPVRKFDKGNPKKTLTVVASGLISVSIWTYMHFVTRRYGTFDLAAVFLSGILVFVIIFKKRNFVPTMLAHVVYDILAVS